MQVQKIPSEIEEPIERKRLVNPGCLIVSKNPGDILVAYSIHSGLGLVLWDPVNAIGGIMHGQIPSSSKDHEDDSWSVGKQAICVDRGIEAMVKELVRLGSNPRKLVARIAGCANNPMDRRIIKHGDRNHHVALKTLWRLKIRVANEDIGGTHSRTMTLIIGTGETFVRIGKTTTEL